MILCGDTPLVGVSGQEGDAPPPPKEIRRQEEWEGQVK